MRGKLNAANSNKEYQALKEQIAADEMANSVLSDEILEMFDKIEEHEANVQAVKEKASLERDLADFQQRLETAEKVLPIDFKAEYDRVVRSKGSDALAPLEGETCGSCNVSVTLQMVNEVLLAKPVFCKSCGCLLYKADPSL